jgi:hypothetical protein
MFRKWDVGAYDVKLLIAILVVEFRNGIKTKKNP